MENFLTLELRRTGEILRMRRERGTEGQTVLIHDGSLPPGASGPPLHVHFHQREEGEVKAGSLGARLGKRTIRVPARGLSRWGRAYLVERRGRSPGVERPGSSGG